MPAELMWKTFGFMRKCINEAFMASLINRIGT